MPQIRNYELVTELESSTPPTLSPQEVGNALTATDALSLAGMSSLGLASPGMLNSVADLAGLKAISADTLALISSGAIVLRRDTGQLYQYIAPSSLTSNDHNVVTPTNASGNRWVEVNLLPYVVTGTTRAVLDQDDLIVSDTTAGAQTFTLPTAIGRKGKVFSFKKISASINALNIATTGGQTIDGNASPFSINQQNRCVSIISDDVNWYILQDYTPKEGGEGATDGDWRFFKSGTSFFAQRRESGTWTNKFEFEA